MAYSPISLQGAVCAAAGTYCEGLEGRYVLAAVAVNVAEPSRTVDARFSGTNLAWWQYEQSSTRITQMVKDAGLSLFRLPGGSASDEWHFTDPPPYNGFETTPMMANFVQAAGGDAIVTGDYGSGSPQEAAAMLAYLNAPVGSTVAIGAGDTWSNTSQAWVSKDWKTAGYWAGLRAATPLATDDNHANGATENHRSVEACSCQDYAALSG